LSYGRNFLFFQALISAAGPRRNGCIKPVVIVRRPVAFCKQISPRNAKNTQRQIHRPQISAITAPDRRPTEWRPRILQYHQTRHRHPRRERRHSRLHTCHPPSR